MKLRRVTVTFDLETNLSLRDLKGATLTVRWRRAWHLRPDRNKPRDVQRIAESYPKDPIIYYRKVRVRRLGV